MGEETDKIVRTSGEALIVKHSPEEEKYRSKYLPDPKKLTDEKLVCTVCSVSLAADIHKGKEIFIHRVLRVLVCEVCYNFYGDGCFSTDEDGDDKYCRWCGQGGTLYLCCACNCAFCQKCVKQNLKSSVLAELENDDWKCYICNPRPLFGCRTICWGAEELNKIGKAKEQERIKKLKEKQEKLEEKKKEENGRRSRKVSTSEGENSTTRKRTRGRNSDSSSPEIMPTKRPKRDSRGTSNSRNTNRGRRKKDESSSSDESEDTKRPKKSRKNKHSDSSSEVSFVFKSRSKTKLKKKKGKESLDESSGEDQTKIKHKSVKKKELISDSDNESSDKDHSKNKRLSRKKNDVSTFSENRKQKKSKSNSKKNKETSSDESSGDEKNKKRGKKKEESSDEDSDGRNRKGNKTEASKKGKRKEAIDSDKEQKTRKKEENAEEVIDENTGEAKTNLSSKETSLLTDNAIVKKRINLAVLWLSNTVKDIAELGSLITVRATKFSNKRVNTDYLKTYEDVISTVSKLKQFLSGIHSNYDHIEKNLDTHVKNWKIMTGLEESENEKTVDRDCSTIENIPGSMGTSTVISNESSLVSPTKNSGLKMEVEDTDKAFKLNQEEPAGEMKSQFSRLSAVESENDNVTSNLISSAKETLNKEQTDLKSEKPKNTEIGQSEFKDSFNSSNIKIGDKSSELNSTDLKDPKSDSDGLAKEKNLDIKNKKDKEANHLNSSRSPNKEDKNSDNEDNLEESKTTTKKVEEMDSKTELETSENEKTSPLKKHMEGSSKNDVKGSPSKGLGSTGLEEKSGSPDVGKLSVSQNGFDLSPDSASSSDESSILEAFKKRIEKKWTLKRQPEDMNLKTSPGIDSTEDTEENYNLAQDEVKNKVLKKTETKEKDGSKDRKRKLCSTKPKKHRGSDSNSENEGSKNKTNVKNKIRKSKNTKEVKRKVENNAHKNKVSEDEMSVEEPEEQKDKNNGKKLAGVKTKPEKSKVKEEEGSKDEGENNQEKIVSKHNKTVCDDKEENTNEEKKENTFEDSIEIDEKIEEESDNSELENAANEYRKYLENEEKTKFDGLESSSKGSDKEIEVAKVGASRDTEEETTRKSSMLLCNEKTKFVGLESSSEESDREVKLAKVGASKDAEEENTMKRSELFCDKKTKFVGLGSSSEELDKELKVSEVEACGDIQGGKTTKNSKGKEKSLKKRSERNKVLSKKPILLESSDEEQDKKEEEDSENSGSSDKEETKKESEKGKKKPASPVLLSSGDSSDSEIIPQKKIRKKSSDSEVLEISEDEKPKKKRKRIKCADSSDESGGSGGKRNVDEKSTQGESPGKGGRKNIKKIKTKDDLEEATKEAAEEEKERRRRIEERQKLFNQMFEIPETQSLDKLVLDFDPKEKKELISVNKDLVAKMKPHQAKGVKFMWDSCFESLSELKTKKGSGCILAHCMGLGKTFQVISLIHTVLTHEDTGVHTVMVVCPLSTVLNWVNEFDKWLDGIEGGDEVEVFHLTRYKTNPDRARELRRWQHNGGVLVIGYEMFRNLTCETAKKFKPKIKKDFQETLIDPGADLIVCDEGHMLKNEATALSKAMTRVKTLRRIVLTGTPMQNNLKEYHCMVQFVKPSLLGTRREFLNRFVNPITNGQFVDSTESDVKVMKRRAHVLHKMLEGLVQRFDYNVLTPFLPPKHEYVISVCLSELQVKLYKHYLENFSQQSDNTKAGSRLFQDWQALGRIWTHPRVLKMNTDKTNWLKEKKALEDESEDEEGSLKDFIDDSEAETTEESSDDSSSEASIKSEDEKKKKKGPAPKITTRSTRSRSKNVSHLDSSGEEKEEELQTLEDIPTTGGGAWWSEMVDPEHLDDINHSAKLVLLFAILKECQMIEDKVLVFSQSLLSLDLIEYFLDKIDEATQQNSQQENLGNHQGAWSKGLDYFRLDGSTSSENRNLWCKAFNRDDNPRARLFLISTRAGGLGINLTAANRVIIFDASWNPSHDVQSIFRVYRFGQKKPCYVYRFIAHGTMEEKVYDRQVAKQSMSNRVVDEQQVHRHFSSNDLNELYSFTPPTKKEDRPIPALPKDNLFAEILQQFRDWIEKYHEHDSLLENVVEEELNEEERKLAWEDYETEKKRGFLPQTTGMGPSNIYNNTMNQQIELLRQALKSKYPNKPEQELNQMLVYQVSLLMKQQQMARSQAGGSAVPGMYQAQPHPLPFMNNKLTQEQLFNLQQQQLRMQYLQQMQMRQAQQATPTPEPKLTEYQKQVLMQQQASLAMLQMKQLQHQQRNSQAQNILLNKLNQPKKRPQAMNNQYPKNAFPNFQGMGLEQNYEASRQKNPGVKITEITDDPLDTTKPSDSST